MTSFTQPIRLRGELVALVIDDQAVMARALPDADAAAVQRMCLFAMQIRDGERPGPYRDADAEREARHLPPPRPLRPHSRRARRARR